MPGGPAAAVATTPSFRKLVSTAIERRFEPSTSWLDLLFDFQFKKYLTPWIIKGQWAFCVFSAVLALLFLISLTVAAWMPWEYLSSLLSTGGEPPAVGAPRGEPLQPAHPQGQFEIEFGAPPPELGIQFARGAIMTLFCLFTVAVIVQILLLIRMSLENCIVIFNIAESLASIDRKTRPA